MSAKPETKKELPSNQELLDTLLTAINSSHQESSSSTTSSSVSTSAAVPAQTPSTPTLHFVPHPYASEPTLLVTTLFTSHAAAERVRKLLSYFSKESLNIAVKDYSVGRVSADSVEDSYVIELSGQGIIDEAFCRFIAQDCDDRGTDVQQITLALVTLKEKWQTACKDIADAICIVPKQPRWSLQKIPQEPLDYFLDTTSNPAILRSENTFSTEAVAMAVRNNVVEKIGNKAIQIRVAKKGNSYLLVVSGKVLPPKFGEYLSERRTAALLHQENLPKNIDAMNDSYRATYQKIISVPSSFQREPINITYTWDPATRCLKAGELPSSLAKEINQYLSKVLHPAGIRAVLVARPGEVYSIRLTGPQIQCFAEANKFPVNAESKESKIILDIQKTIDKLSIEGLVYAPQKVGASYCLYTQDFDQKSAYKLADALANRFKGFAGIEVSIEPTTKPGILRVGLSGWAITPEVGKFFLKQKSDHLARITTEKITAVEMPLRLETAAAAGSVALVKELLEKKVAVTERVIRQAISSPKAPAVMAELLPTFNAAFLIKAIEYAERRVVEEAKAPLSSSSSSSSDTDAKHTAQPAPMGNAGYQTLQLLLGEYENIKKQLSSIVLYPSREMLTLSCHENSSNIITLQVKNELDTLEAKQAENSLRDLSLVKRYSLEVTKTTTIDEGESDTISNMVEVGGILFANGFGHYLQKEHGLRLSTYKVGEGDYHRAIGNCLCIPIPIVNTSAMGRLFSSQPEKMDYTWDKTGNCVQSVELDNAETAAQVQDKLIIQLARVKLNVQVAIKSTTKGKCIIQLRGEGMSEAFVTCLQQQKAKVATRELSAFFEGSEKKDSARPRTQSTQTPSAGEKKRTDPSRTRSTSQGPRSTTSSERSRTQSETGEKVRARAHSETRSGSKESADNSLGTERHYKFLALSFCIPIPSNPKSKLYYTWNKDKSCAQSTILSAVDALQIHEMLHGEKNGKIKLGGAMTWGIKATIVPVGSNSVICLTGPYVCEAIAYLQQPVSPPADSKRSQTLTPKSQQNGGGGKSTVSAPHSRVPGIGGASSPQPTAPETLSSDEQRQYVDKLLGNST